MMICEEEALPLREAEPAALAALVRGCLLTYSEHRPVQKVKNFGSSAYIL